MAKKDERLNTEGTETKGTETTEKRKSTGLKTGHYKAAKCEKRNSKDAGLPGKEHRDAKTAKARRYT